jgi:predicted SAM-dependent methyltransferase
VKLHLGCFDVPLEGWHNTDVTMHIVVARIPLLAEILYAVGALGDVRYRQHKAGIFRQVHYLDATKRFPFKDDSVDAIYSSHMIGNLTRDQALRCLREARRVLKCGCVLRLAVPDLDAWIAAYDPGHPDALLNLFYLPATKRKKNHTRWVYNPRSLRSLFEEAGFRNVTQYEISRGNCPDVERIDYRTDSMFMEGTK